MTTSTFLSQFAFVSPWPREFAVFLSNEYRKKGNLLFEYRKVRASNIRDELSQTRLISKPAVRHDEILNKQN